MSHHKMLHRKNSILKRKIRNMMLRQNQNGLSGNESRMLEQHIKEFHTTTHKLSQG